MHSSPRAALVALLVALTAALTGCGGTDPPADVKMQLPAQTVVADRDNTLDSVEQTEAADRGEGAGIHEDARDETPPGIAPTEAAKGLDDTAAQGKGPPRPVGGAQTYSCPQRFVRNYSSRNGQPVLLFVLHYTVSKPSSLDAIRGLFNTPSFGASSTYGIEFTGRCQQWVPNSAKPWTQGNLNDRSESVEIFATGSESRRQWLDSPLIKRGILAALVRDRLPANGLPLRRVDPDGCGVQRAGRTDHDSFECGNSHHDVTPNFPFDVFARQLAAGGVTRTDQATCRKVNAWRAAGRPRGGDWHDNTLRRLKALEQRGVTCSTDGATR